MKLDLLVFLAYAATAFASSPDVPTQEPSIKPSRMPSLKPTAKPSVVPSIKPTREPTVVPTKAPTEVPSIRPSDAPTVQPSVVPTEIPTIAPTRHPTISGPGWLIESYYSTEAASINDTTDPLVVFGRRSGECLGAFDDEFFYVASCGTNYVTLLLYNDSTCTTMVEQLELNYLETYHAYWGAPFQQYWYGGAFLKDAHFVQYECVTDEEQYSFATVYENTTYAVTEFFSRDDSLADDQLFQCRNDYTEFAAYRKDYCFNVKFIYLGNVYNDWDYKFTADDNTYIRQNMYYAASSCTNEAVTRALFQVNDCNENFLDRDDEFKDTGDYYHNNAKSRTNKQSRPSATNMLDMARDVLLKSQGKHVMTIEEKDQLAAKMVEKKVDATNIDEFFTHLSATATAADADANKEAEGFSSTYTYASSTSQLYFTDDNGYYNDYYYHGPPKLFSYLSSYHMWVNVPALPEDTPSPMEWFTEMMYFGEGEDRILGMINTRKTMTCMPFYFAESILFNYQVVCDTRNEYDDDGWYQWIHVLQFSADDFACQGDYYTLSYTDEQFTVDDEIGRREFDDATTRWECSNTRFGEKFTNLTESAAESYATEIFYPLTAWNESECTDSDTDITMGVAFLEDYCFNFWVDYETNDDGDENRQMSFIYEANLENQNIEFTVYKVKGCKDRFLHQTKEIGINTCSDEQQNTFYNPVYKYGPIYGGDGKTKDLEKSKADLAAGMKSVSDKLVNTPFTNFLNDQAKKMLKKSDSKNKNKKTPESADKEVEYVSTSTYYYYYYDDAAAFLNNRQGDKMKNMWFTVPATPTIAPSVVPTLMPSVEPTVVPTVEPTLQPSEHPSMIPTIEPSKAPNPPTYRPSPSAGQPTASPTHQITYSFSVTQTLNNIDVEDFESDVNNTIAFKEAVAMALTPLTSDNIDIYEVVNTTSARRLRALSAQGIDISYSVTYRLAETGYHDATSAYNALISSLTTAIVDTDLFNGYIQVAAAQNSFNAPDLLDTTTANSFTATDATEVGTDDDYESQSNTHKDLIAGLVVGLGLGLFVIGLIYWYIFGCTCCRSRSSGEPSSVTTNEKEVAMNGQI